MGGVAQRNWREEHAGGSDIILFQLRAFKSKHEIPSKSKKKKLVIFENKTTGLRDEYGHFQEPWVM